MEYSVELEIYKGPINLLCHLIEKNKIDIYDIPIHIITKQYVDHVEKLKEMDLDITSEFILMSATLIEIKSKMLLPKKEEDIEDPRDELVQKIVEYKKIKTVLEELKNRKEEYDKIYFKPKDEIEVDRKIDLDLSNVTIEDLTKTFLKIIEKKDKSEEKKEKIDVRIISKEEITVEEGQDIIKKQLLSSDKKLEEILLYENNITKNKIIVLFLSLLELIKRKEIIIIEKNNENYFRNCIEG